MRRIKAMSENRHGAEITVGKMGRQVWIKCGCGEFGRTIITGDLSRRREIKLQAAREWADHVATATGTEVP